MFLAGKQILIVEDNILIAEVVADTIADFGGQPLGPVFSPSEALDMINYNPGAPDAAILDLGICGSVLEVAERLKELCIPFIFATGDPTDIPEVFRSYPVCAKPYSPQNVAHALHLAIDSEGDSAISANPLHLIF